MPRAYPMKPALNRKLRINPGPERTPLPCALARMQKFAKPESRLLLGSHTQYWVDTSAKATFFLLQQ